MLYSDGTFPQLAQTWQSLDRGDSAATKRALANGTPPAMAAPPGMTALPAMEENFAAASLALQCGDTSWPRGLDAYQRDVAADRKRYPLVGAMTANITPCARWPLAPKEKPTEITDRGRTNILILQNLRDPATIHSGAVQLRRTLGDRARMASIDAGAHGAYLSGNACADNLTTRYLVRGELPDGDRTCAAL